MTHTKGHWLCPDCGEWCGCTDELAILLPHVRCGLAPGHVFDPPTELEPRRRAEGERERIFATYERQEFTALRRDTMVGE